MTDRQYYTSEEMKQFARNHVAVAAIIAIIVGIIIGLTVSNIIHTSTSKGRTYGNKISEQGLIHECRSSHKHAIRLDL